MHASFVTLGQLIKFAYDATGVLPRKRSEQTGLKEKDIKRIQKQLERLVDEDGSLMERYEELIQSFASELRSTIPNVKVNAVIGEILMDLFEVYQAVVCKEGTYSPPVDSVHWFCREHAIPRLALSIQKHTLSFNVTGEGFLLPPDADWYLPTISDTQIQWPLGKVISWIYAQYRISQTQFHRPGKVAMQDDPKGGQYLENASNWLTGEAFPSWSGLRWNFSQSIDRLNHAEAPYRRQVSANEKESILYVLFLARLSTYVTKQLHDAYGIEALSDMLEQFKRHRDLLSAELKTFKDSTNNYVQQSGAKGADADRIWYAATNKHWQWLSDRALACGIAIQPLVEVSVDHSIPESLIAQLSDQHGEYMVHSTLDKVRSSHIINVPPGFMAALIKGCELKDSNATKDADIEAYALELNDIGLNVNLEWMLHWNRAVLRYRDFQDDEAFLHIEKAFNLAQYTAGKFQYEIVNQFIELAAKTKNWKKFKKGVAWANFLGLSVRWLRGKEPSDENLRNVFDCMKPVRYPI